MEDSFFSNEMLTEFKEADANFQLNHLLTEGSSESSPWT